MKYAAVKYTAAFLLTCFLAAVPVSAETLHYVINWPSGLNLGEATLTSNSQVAATGLFDPQKPAGSANAPAAHATNTAWEFHFTIDASVPGFPIEDEYHSKASGAEICSTTLEKTVRRGRRHSEETVSFDQDQHRVTRETHSNGGRSDYDVPACARGALAFLQFARDELSQGRLPAQQPVILGAAYNVRMEFAGTQTVKEEGKPVQADHIRATIKGPASNHTVDIFFAHDATRTPVLIRIPLALGTFSAELTH
jgi:Protein of unknown function (DUF3108)